MKTTKVLRGLALTALIALSLIGSAGGAALSARGNTQGVTWENDTVARAPQNQNSQVDQNGQGPASEFGVTWE
ncbi:MAG TPA: hypothetical protein VI814_09190 [Candidatus Limnocylindria bacterium]